MAKIKVKYLVVHHTAGNITETIKQIKDYAISQGYSDIPYNRLINHEGKVFRGRPDDMFPAHALGINQESWGICCIGNYSKYKPSDAMIHSLIQTLAILCKENGIKDVNRIIGHCDVAKLIKNPKVATDCPSKNLYSLLPMIRKEVKKYL